MPPKKAKSHSKPAVEAKDTPQEAPVTATETAEPPKDAVQPIGESPSSHCRIAAPLTATEGKLGEPISTNGAIGHTNDESPKSDSKDENTAEKDVSDKSSEPSSKKRKNAAGSAKPKKEPRVGTRTPSARNSRSSSQPSQQQILVYLLSQEAEEFVRPDDEKEDLKKDANLRTYTSSLLSPFEELMCAVILSRPISHTLGMRTIRTILNKPYEFTTPKALKDAGEAKILEAMDNARTQHRGKTANELALLASLVVDKYTSDADKDGAKLKKVLLDNDNDYNQALASLKKEVKGLGANGENIFLRRAQWFPGWDDAYPFIDPKAEDALRKVGLPRDREGLRRLIDQHWAKLNTKNMAGDGDATKKKRAFFVVLERCIVADLEQRIDDVLAAAAA
ncbi:Hypothetical predicted protein [Lecanosticta acicola]|uniref:Uncharacterized protein n=1 Tax=Lecanosticta acicola TaxID=111012 RepID=A0AAI8YUJ1_9PEZI|nr:Hypothetical predicted protein [Lecanosticta acicola]